MLRNKLSSATALLSSLGVLVGVPVFGQESRMSDRNEARANQVISTLIKNGVLVPTEDKTVFIIDANRAADVQRLPRLDLESEKVKLDLADFARVMESAGVSRADIRIDIKSLYEMSTATQW